MLQATGRKWAYIMIRIIWYWLTNPIITVHVNNKLTTYVIHVIATEFRCNCLANKYPVGKHDRLQLRDTLQRKRTYYETTRLNEKKKLIKWIPSKLSINFEMSILPRIITFTIDITIDSEISFTEQD